MFALRGIAVSLALFWLSYCALSVLVACSGRYLEQLRNLSARVSANLLFAARKAAGEEFAALAQSLLINAVADSR